MKHLKIGTYSLGIVVLIGFALLLFSSSAHAQATGATDIDITLQGIVILHYFTDIDVTMSAAELGAYLTGTAGDSSIGEGTASGNGFNPDLAMSPSALTGDPSAALLTLQNSWAVRAIGNSGANTQVSISLTDDTLTHPDGDTITITSATVSSGAVGPGASIQFAPPGLFIPRRGNVLLTLDLSSATVAGAYADAVFTLTAQNL